MQSPVKIIAELSWNHVGDLDLAKKMIFAAKESGADYVKFQTWKANRLKPGPWDSDGRRQLYEKSELTPEKHHQLLSICNDHQIKFLTSCFCIQDLSFVRQFSNEVKIPSPEGIEKQFVYEASSKFDEVFVSTGASTKSEFSYLFELHNVTVLHCVSSYPCRHEDFHWDKFMYIKSMSNKFGFSGHFSGIWDAILAISHGAQVIEKHFTIDRTLPGKDNRFALLPYQLKEIREYADNYVKMKSSYSLNYILECEKEYRKYHKSRWCG
jgi:N,N'-diacetyllegionaminate synthase